MQSPGQAVTKRMLFQLSVKTGPEIGKCAVGNRLPTCHFWGLNIFVHVLVAPQSTTSGKRKAEKY